MRGKSQMKIGVVLSDLPPNIGGSYRFQADIFAALQVAKNQSCHEFIVLGNISSSLPNIPFRLNLLEKITMQTLNWHPVFYKIWRRLSRLEKIIKTHEIEMLWFVSLDYIPANIPYIVTILDVQHLLQPWFPEVNLIGISASRHQNYAKMLRSASVIITSTEVGKKEVEFFYQVPAQNIKVVPFATPSFALNADQNPEISATSPEAFSEVFSEVFSDLPEFRSSNFCSSDLFSKGFLFYPAQFWAHKNHVGLLLAVKNLRDQYNLNFPLVFAGSNKGNLEFIKQKVAELRLEQVYFLGFVSQDQLIWLYRYAFALVFPTFFGPDNLPPLEAFALGCPVIASRVDGASEQFGSAALLFDPKQPEDLAMAIKSLKENPELRQNLINLGLARAKQWTGADYVKSICQICDDFAPYRQCWPKS